MIRDKIDDLSWSYIIVVFSLCCTLVPGWIPFARKEWMVLAVGVLTTFAIYQRYFNTTQIKYLLVYFAFLYLNVKMHDHTFSSTPVVVFEVCQWMVPSAIFFYAIEKDSKKFIKYMLWSFYAIILVQSFTSYFITRTYPTLIRELETLTRETGDRSFTYSYYKMGLMDYSILHAFPALIPPFFALIRENRKKMFSRYFYLLLLALTCLLIMISSSGTATLLMVLMIALSFMASDGGFERNKRKFIVIILISIPLILSENIQVGVIEAAKSVTPTESVIYSKLESIQESLTDDNADGDVEARKRRYQKSIDGFLSNPIIGTNKETGGHAALLERFACLGVLGALPLLLFLKLQVNKTLVFLADEKKIYYVESLLAAFVIFALKNTSIVALIIIAFVIVPLMLDASKNNIR